VTPAGQAPCMPEELAWVLMVRCTAEIGAAETLRARITIRPDLAPEFEQSWTVANVPAALAIVSRALDEFLEAARLSDTAASDG
jgi:hypothetical protein